MSTQSRVDALNFFVGLLVATLVCVAVLVPQLWSARSDRDVARAERRGFVHQLVTDCVVHPDGSFECPAETLFLTTTTTSTSTVVAP